MKVAAIDIGGTSIKGGLLEGETLKGLLEVPTGAREGGDHVIERAKEILHSMGTFDMIGISTAGQVDPQKGEIRYANENIPGYTGMRIQKIMEQEFGVPTAVENDVNAAAIGESVYGAGKGYSDFLCLTYGTGVGGAIVSEGKIYRGSSFSAGEFGGIVTHGNRREVGSDPFCGCYERYASATALVKKAMELDERLDNGRKIFERLEESEVRAVVDQWILEISHGLTTLIHIFNPPCIILGGGVMQQTYILDKLKEMLYHGIMDSFRDVELKQAQLGNKAGLLGAAWSVLERERG